MKKFLILILAGGFATAAAAQQPAADVAQPQEGNAATAIGADSSDELAERNCLRYTGSRIVASRNATRIRKSEEKAPDGCVNAAGRSYTQDDIRRTGQTNVADALRMLDPSVH